MGSTRLEGRGSVGVKAGFLVLVVVVLGVGCGCRMLSWLLLLLFYSF